MSEHKNNSIPAGKQKLRALMESGSEFYTIKSVCTKEPYVVCNPETFDDQVLLFFSEEDGAKEEKRLLGEKIPVQLDKLDGKQILHFFTGLYTMGVNALLIKEGEAEELIQLEDIVKRKHSKEMPDGSVWIENPQLHLTALYFAQELRKQSTPETASRLLELQEEIAADFKKGSYLFVVDKEGKGTPMVKMKDNHLYQPVFTDILEFQKFDKDRTFRPVAVKASEIPKVLSAEAKGVVLNLMGVNLPLSVER